MVYVNLLRHLISGHFIITEKCNEWWLLSGLTEWHLPYGTEVIILNFKDGLAIARSSRKQN